MSKNKQKQQLWVLNKRGPGDLNFCYVQHTTSPQCFFFFLIFFIRCETKSNDWARHFSNPCDIITIIMYSYHALINAMSAHMILINLNMIFYTHVEHSPTKTIYIKYYMCNGVVERRTGRWPRQRSRSKWRPQQAYSSNQVLFVQQQTISQHTQNPHSHA